MFSPIARDLLRPHLFDRIDSLMKPDLPFAEDPWNDGLPKSNAYSNRVKDLLSCKRSSAFQLFLNVKQFQPRDIDVKIEDGFIVVKGKHDVKPDMHGYVFREFTRRCKIPDNVEPATLRCTFKKNGLLLIKASEKLEKAAVDGEHSIPIEIQKPLILEADLTEEKKKIPLESEIEIPVANGIL